VTNVETLGCEGVGLDLDIRARDVLQKRGLANIGETRNDKCAGVGVDRGQTTQMLPDLLKVDEGVLEPLADCGHATQRGLLQLLALKERLSVLQETNVVTGDGLDQRLGGRQLTKRDAEVVCIVEGVEQIAVERVDILQAGEGIDRLCEALGEGLGGVLDLTGVEGSDTADLEACTNLRPSKYCAPREICAEIVPEWGDASGSSTKQYPRTPGS
jgi:hypothetical protein